MVRRRDDIALGIQRIRTLTPFHREAVDLVALHRERHCLGRLTQRDRQDARCQRVQRSGMPGLLRIEDAAHGRDGLGGGHVQRLVQDHPAMDVLALLAAAHSQFSLSRRGSDPVAKAGVTRPAPLASQGFQPAIRIFTPAWLEDREGLP